MNSKKGGEAPKVDQISDGVEGIKLEQEDGPWEVSVKRSKNKTGKHWAPWNTAPGKAPANPWRQNTSAGRGDIRPHSSNRAFPINPALARLLEKGWNWNSRAGASNALSQQDGGGSNKTHVEDDDDSDAVDSDDELCSDDFDSDGSVQSFKSRKKNNKNFKEFFSMLDKLCVEEINEPSREWHCPACQGGPGSIDWYRGLQAVMTHAKSKGSKRVKLHRELAELLDKELQEKGTSVVPAEEAFGKWIGLKENAKYREIVWPPMVVIMNTKLEQDETNDKWIGMGNQELLDYFSEYDATRARHSYGPQGHREMSMLIFEANATGYLEAERLHKHFEEQGTDRKAWDHRRVLFSAGGNRQLYGYMAEKHDINFFNQHSQGKTWPKYDMRSYHEVIVTQLKQMSEENQQLIYFKEEAAREKRHSKAVEESHKLVTGQLRRKCEENRIVRQRSKERHEESIQEVK